MTVVQIAVDYPGTDNPAAYQAVLVQLVAGLAGGSTTGGVVVNSERVKLDADGEGSITLVPNDEVAEPDSYYRFTVVASSPTVVRCIRIDADTPGTVSWSYGPIQVEEIPAGTAVVPSAVGQPDGRVLGSVSEHIAWIDQTGGGGGGIVHYAFQVDSADPTGENPVLPLDGTATMLRATTYEGPVDLPVELFVGKKIAFDHTNQDGGRPYTMYVVTAQVEGEDPVPWVEVDVLAGDLVWFHATGQMGVGFNNDGDLQQMVPGTPAKQINALNVATDRVFVTGEAENYTPIVLPADHDDPAKNLEQHRRGIDAKLGELEAGGGGGGLVLGETSTTAYRGDRGAAAYDHSQATGNPHGTSKADVGLGSVDNVSAASLRDRSTHTGTQSADTLTDGTTNRAFLATERTKLSGIASGATANSADATLLARANHTGTQAPSTITGTAVVTADARLGESEIRLLPAARYTGSTPVMSMLVPLVSAGSTVAITAGQHALAPTRGNGGTLASLGILVSATSLTSGQTVEINCYADQADGTPGARLWSQTVTVGTTTGTITVTGLSLTLPVGPCWIGLLNPSGNAGSVTLRSGVATTSPRFVAMQNGNWFPMLDLTGVAASSTDMSAYLLRASSAGSTSLGVGGLTTFPVIGAGS